MGTQTAREFLAFVLLLAEDELGLDAESSRRTSQTDFIHAVNKDADGAACGRRQLSLRGRNAEDEQTTRQAARSAMTRQLQFAQRGKKAILSRTHGS